MRKSCIEYTFMNISFEVAQFLSQLVQFGIKFVGELVELFYSDEVQLVVQRQDHLEVSFLFLLSGSCG
jgi:hypothetical protein